MVLTFSIILLGLIALVRPLQRNPFFMLNSALIIGAAYLMETFWRSAPPFHYKTVMLFVVFQVIFINITTFFAYGVDKRAAVRRRWRVSENNLHMLEFLGGWLGAWIAQRFFNHKTTKISYQRMYKVMIIMEFAAIWFILKFLNII